MAGAILASAGKDLEAAKYLRKAIKLDPNNESAWSYKTNLLLEAAKLADRAPQREVGVAGGIGRIQPDSALEAEPGGPVLADALQHPAHGDRTALFAEPDDLLVDLSGRGRGQRDNHGRLHSRPNRWTISKADGGPQVPDS